ncbi:amidohydrolase [Anaerosalibacter massiliensis]|uniref:Amidohydrolase n=1 Tax=Anaerosalibacter massiliensis TaxID=1347392 RepID=A0A9X2MIS2_9FIRM|nr:amidohydrolase [Anaerosalibacter massiliensis]MCR2044780.1 amidohydrolase [Anaerosalibacter massiliensis]
MILIKNGYIYTMAGETIEGGSILVDDGKIVEIGKDIVAPLDAKVIDAEGRMITPGFIDAHCHLGMWEDGMGFEGDDGNEWVEPVTPHLRAIDGINPMDITFKEAYEGGVTTAVTGPGSANVVGGQFVAVKTYGKRVDDMIVKEPVAMKIAFGENPKRVHEDQKQSPITRMATAAKLRETLFEAKEYLNKKEEGVEDPSKMPEYDMKMEAMIKVLKKEIPLKAHAHRADDILTAIRIAKEFALDITLDHCTEGHLIADILAEEGKPALVGPSLTDRSKIELRNQTFDTPRILNEAGVKIAIITDSPVIPLQYLSLCAGLAAKSGLDEMEALKAITINPAEIVGISDRVGSLEVGKDADIVIFDGNPLKDIDCKTFATIIDGKVVYRR